MNDIILQLKENYNTYNRGYIITGYFNKKTSFSKKESNNKYKYLMSSVILSLAFKNKIDLGKINNEIHNKIKTIYNDVRKAGFRILDNVTDYNYIPKYIPDAFVIPVFNKHISILENDIDKSLIRTHRNTLKQIANKKYTLNYDEPETGQSIIQKKYRIVIYKSLQESVDYCENKINTNSFYKLYNKHNKGYIIYAPRGSGKSYFLNKLPLKNKKKDFVDWCYLYNHLLILKGTANSNKNNGLNKNQKLNAYEIVNKIARKNNLKLFTARTHNIKPKAIVLIPWNKHKEYIKQRNEITPTDILRSRLLARNYAKKYNIPIFKSFKDAINYCERMSKTKFCCCLLILLCLLWIAITELNNNKKS